MTFYVENETGVEFEFDIEEVVQRVCEAVLKAEKCPFDTQINVLLTDNAGIREFNRDYRQIDRETDVLSFPNMEFAEPGRFELRPENEADCLDPDTGELILGDIIISVDRVREQAREYGHSQKREFAFLVAHSMFHLCGYDHMEERERLLMEEKQEAVLNDLGITRENN